MFSAVDIETNLAEIIQLRHRLHRIPELAYEEVQTAGVVREEWLFMRQEHDGCYSFSLSNAPTHTALVHLARCFVNSWGELKPPMHNKSLDASGGSVSRN